jgi:hypothetical protein
MRRKDGLSPAGIDKKMLAQTFEYAAVWHLEKIEFGEELTDEEERNVETFHALKKFVKDIPPTLNKTSANWRRNFRSYLSNRWIRLSGAFATACFVPRQQSSSSRRCSLAPIGMLAYVQKPW